MFATLVGGYPKVGPGGLLGRGRDGGPSVRETVKAPAVEDVRAAEDALVREHARAAEDALVREVIEEQEQAGLEPITDGHVRWADPISPIAAGLDGFDDLGAPGDVVPYFDAALFYRRPRATREPRWIRPITLDDWRFAASCTTLAVKQSIVGPYTLGRLADAGDLGQERLTLVLAEALNHEISALATAGCPLVQIDEDAATLIGDDPNQQRLFRDAQRRLLDGVAGTHLSLSITMGNADAAGIATIFDAPYHSYLFDLIAGPDNWRLIARAPGDRGIIVGAMDARSPKMDDKEVLIWAAHYAASTGGRGLTRVGLAPSSSLEFLPRDVARKKIMLLGETVRIASAGTTEEVIAALDPRAIDIRSAAHGRYVHGGRGSAEGG